MDPIVKLLLFSVIMLVLPIYTYFSASRGDLDDLLAPIIGPKYLDTQRAVVSGALAVVVVNLVTVVYVVLAFLEPVNVPEQQKKAQ